MAIDGRTLMKPPEQPKEPDAYESAWVGLVSHALIWVPLAVIVWLAYATGTWIGGVAGGLWSVASTVATGVGIWAWRRFSKRHRKA